ncbi:MAG: hypothetical protein M1827_006823 [Pycnora praestabilis]|nr:MAG: hypothetical protein M1827_006823 [Pycnora praestabilis]
MSFLDYLHLTKRFGIVAASQLPIHYLLSVKSASFPLSALTRLSYEELNPYHRMLGRILIFFFFLHATFYLNFYALSGLLAKKLRDRVVILGLLAITSFLIIGLTSLAKVRNWNYRLFFFIHVALSSVLLPILYFHVSHIRIYIWETAAVYVLNVVLRTINTKVYTTTISMVQGTSLIKMTIPSPTSCDRLAAGQHVYLQPPSTTSYSPLNRLRLHPFTVASLPSEDNTVTLVARQLSGTTHYLANLTKGRSERDIQLAVEGPYGAAANFPDFSTYERILLVAGGVGATFTVPIYRRLLQAISLKGQSTRKVRFLWAVRSMTETSWALEGKAATEMRQKAEIYLTHSGASSDPAGISEDAEDGGESVEMQEREQLLDDEDAVETGAKVTRCGRPDLRRIVDEVFRQGEAERVAVLVCGPPGLGSSLRTHVGRWVFRGRDVFWHAEEFGW